MTPEQQKIIDRLMDRLSKIQWGYVPDGINRRRSTSALFREHLHRVRLCGVQLDKSGRYWIPIDIGEEHDTLNKAVSEIIESLVPIRFPSITHTVIRYFFLWELLKPDGACIEPYEPIIRFYERGGMFKPDHVLTDVWAGGKHAGGHSTRLDLLNFKRQPLLDLSDEALDTIDVAKS